MVGGSFHESMARQIPVGPPGPRAALVAAALLLAGCLGAVPGDTAGPSEGSPGDADEAFDERVWTFEGTLTGAPGSPDRSEDPFEVPANATGVGAVLTWGGEGADLDLTLLGPDGEEQATGWPERDGRESTAVAGRLAAGNWTVRVASDQAVDEDFAVEVTVWGGSPEHRVLEESTEIGPRVPGATRGFAEINLAMAPGQRFNWSWQADGELYFNVHYHADGETERPVEERTDGHAGTFTAPAAEIYSLLWLNEGATPVDLEATVDGVFRLHSRSR